MVVPLSKTVPLVRFPVSLSSNDVIIKKKKNLVLAGVAQWTEHWPVNQRVAGLIPSQGTCLGCGPGPQ